MQRFPFRWTTTYRLLAGPFLVTPSNAEVEVDEQQLTIRFGRWTLRTPTANVVSTEVTSGYSVLKTAGPPHLSFVDRGITFATNPDRGLCIEFETRVPAIEPFGRIRHPAATVTVADIDGLQRALGR
jgi:hypothetical protein